MQRLRLLFVADARSTHTAGWLEGLASLGFELHLATYYACDPAAFPNVMLHEIPIWNPAVGASPVKAVGLAARRDKNLLGRALAHHPLLREAVRPAWESVLTLQAPLVSRSLAALVQRVVPDLIHALRFQIEGYTAARIKTAPMIVSAWGADFTYFVAKSLLHRYRVRGTLRRADAFLADCVRDVRIARELGLRDGIPARVWPGGGGIDLTVFKPGDRETPRRRWDLPANGILVVYPRGIAGPFYRFETFLTGVARVAPKFPEACFAVVGGEDVAEAERAVRVHNLTDRVRLLPAMRQEEMAALLRTTDAIVSPTLHDGTPNTMLEAMASGALPVMSDLDSIREWIEPGLNGLLFNPRDPESLAREMERSLRDSTLRARAEELNVQLVRERADRKRVRAEVATFYREFLSRGSGTSE